MQTTRRSLLILSGGAAMSLAPIFAAKTPPALPRLGPRGR